MNRNSWRKRGLFLAAAVLLTAGAQEFSETGFQAEAQAVTGKRFSPQSDGFLQRARLMLASGNYAGVIDQLTHINIEMSSLSAGQREDYVMMLSKALFERGDSECIPLLRNFINKYSGSPLALKARLIIGDFYFFNKNWEEALEEYEMVKQSNIDKVERPLYLYRQSLSQLKCDQYEQARQGFASLENYKDYKDASIFYTAYLDYKQGDYDKAYSLFKDVKRGEYGLDAEYYMAQIDYLHGDYAQASATARALTKNGLQKDLLPEANRIAGLSLFKLNEYSEARNYLNDYLQSQPKEISPDALYALGAIDYKEGDYKRAASRFAQLTDLNSDLAQSAWLYLGQCDLQNGDYDAAAMAFEKSQKMGLDPVVTETALYNYVAAVTRGGKVPFASSVELLEGFLKNYPDSEYAPMVEEYLATAFYNDRNYAKALASINRIKEPSKKILQAKQKILYELGVSSMTNGRQSEAIDYLRQAVGMESYDRKLARQAQFWLGDAYYADAKFLEAELAYNAFIKGEEPGGNRTLAIYDLAYALYQQDDYAKAARQFKLALDSKPELPKTLQLDAYIRWADCLYYTGNYKEAMATYQKAINGKSADADYALYRHAMMLGLRSDVNAKIKELGEVETRFPNSKWLPNALLEKAQTLEALGRSAEAMTTFKALSESYPRSTQARKAMLSLAISTARAGKGEEAAETYKNILKTWPTSEEASLANDDLKKYYSSTGQLGEYANFLRGIPEAKQIEDSEIEQLAYEGAATAYAENQKDAELLKKYVRDFPHGKYIAQALYDIAECMIAVGNTTEALQALRDLEATGEQRYLPTVYAGIMRLSTDDSERLKYAKLVAQGGGVSAALAEEAMFCEAESLLKLGRGEEAVPMLEKLAKTPSSEAGAKAAVALGEYYVNNKDYEKAEKTLLDFTDAGTPHHYQLARGFIVLADVYSGMDRKSLSKEYLQSLKENYPGKESDIQKAIEKRLKEL